MYFRSNISEALEWLIEHQDDSDDDNDNNDVNDLGILTERDNDNVIAGSSLSDNTKRRSLKEVCIELFKGGNYLEVVKVINTFVRQSKTNDFLII